MTATTIRVQIAQRKDTAANWHNSNPVLLSGELGYETDTKKLKIGNGSSSWRNLDYFYNAKIIAGNTEAETVDTGSDGHFKVTTEGTERIRVGPAGQIGIAGANYGLAGQVIASGGPSGAVSWGSAIAGLTATAAELNLLDGTTAGTVVASKAVAVDGNKDLAGLRNLTLAGDLTVNGTTTTVNSTTVTIDDKNIELASTESPSDASADGGGITLKGTTDHTWNWIDSTDAWTSSEHIDLASGKEFKINGSSVLSGSTLGSGVTSSSLTSVGTLTSGTWSASTIAVDKGGTGATSASAARTAIGVAIGSDVQAFNQRLADVAGLAATDGGFIVGDGSNFVLETGATARTSIGAQTLAADLTALSSCQTGGASAIAALTSTEIGILDGATVTTTELNLLDGGTSATATTLAAADRMVINDNGTMVQVALSDLVTFLENGTASNLVIDGGSF
tara:strand:+ start:111 stop:1460 length:1350 start_codon:yes stop_codon:yes gene_type:complete